MRCSNGLRAAAGNQGIELPAIGDAFEGGYYAGLISHTANGVPTHALIVAPRATGATGPGYTLTTYREFGGPGAAGPALDSPYDGIANINQIKAVDFISNYGAANFCDTLVTGGFSDWYLPARYELDIAYENLKPTTTVNQTSFGINPYSVPERTVNRTASVPARTSLTAFQLGGTQAFVDVFHFTSTRSLINVTETYTVSFLDGFEGDVGNAISAHVRAFRRVAL
jgi:hypothetical protein